MILFSTSPYLRNTFSKFNIRPISELHSLLITVWICLVYRFLNDPNIFHITLSPLFFPTSNILPVKVYFADDYRSSYTKFIIYQRTEAKSQEYPVVANFFVAHFDKLNSSVNYSASLSTWDSMVFLWFSLADTAPINPALKVLKQLICLSITFYII